MDEASSQGHLSRAARLSTLAFTGQGLYYLLTIVLARTLGVHGFEAYSVAVATRMTPTGAFSAGSVVPSLEVAGFFSNDPDVSWDGLSLYYSSNAPPTMGGADIFVATRPCLD